MPTTNKYKINETQNVEQVSLIPDSHLTLLTSELALCYFEKNSWKESTKK